MAPSNSERIQLIEALEQHQSLLTHAQRSPLTVKGYAHDWKLFSAWCEKIGREALPASPQTVALYLTHLLKDQKKIVTAERQLSAIRYKHRTSGLPVFNKELPGAVISGAKRMLKERPAPKAALSVQDLKKICEQRPKTDCEVRNRAILLFGFATALRRSELVRLTLEDVEFGARGMMVRLRWEKQDQEGRGRSVPVCEGSTPETCAITALREWLKIRGERAGPLFLACSLNRGFVMRQASAKLVCDAVKAEVRRIGLDPSQYGGHSLRAGCITAAYLSGASETNIARHTGHRSFHVLRRYFRARDPWEGSVSGILGL